MLLKNGDLAPETLAQELENDQYALRVFMGMRPSCQNRYVAHIMDSKSIDTQKRRAASAIVQIRKYGQKHNIEEKL